MEPTQPLFDIMNRKMQMAHEQRAGVDRVLADGQWHTAKQIRAALLGTVRVTERSLRIIAEHSDGKIISGQLGYKRTIDATIEEVSHAENWLKSQAAKMVRRANQIRMTRASYSGVPQS